MARSMAARASSSSTPASSNRMRPGCTTATHSSGLPLPEPMRVSAGFCVIGLSGKTRIQTVPPRAAPVRRPRCVLRCLTFFGINMSVRLLAEVRGLVVLVTGLALHLLVLTQLALQVVGLRRLGQQVADRLLELLAFHNLAVQDQVVFVVRAVGRRRLGRDHCLSL